MDFGFERESPIEISNYGVIFKNIVFLFRSVFSAVPVPYKVYPKILSRVCSLGRFLSIILKHKRNLFLQRLKGVNIFFRKYFASFATVGVQHLDLSIFVRVSNTILFKCSSFYRHLIIAPLLQTFSSAT